MINVGMAIELSLSQQLKTNFKQDDEGNYLANDLSEWERSQLKDYISGYWKDVTSPDTGLVYRVVSFYVDEVKTEGAETLKIIDDISARFPPMTIVPVGAWNKDGSQYGTRLVYLDPVVHENGEVTFTEVVMGTPIYPVNDLVMMCMPDEVEYDSMGMEVSRTAPTMIKQLNKVAGWADRRFD